MDFTVSDVGSNPGFTSSRWPLLHPDTLFLAVNDDNTVLKLSR